VQQGDPLHLLRGVTTGTLNLERLDASGTTLSIFLSPTFGLGFPDPGVEHMISISDLEVHFGS
jgi:hypothetical protein